MRSSLIKLALSLAAGLFVVSCGKPAVKTADAAEVAAAQAFLAKNAKVEGVRTLPSGLQYRVIRSGPADGAPPKPGDEVKVNYEGSLVDGTVFDSSYEKGVPMVSTVGELVPGWNEALTLMRPGDSWYLYVPSKLGYGDHGAGPVPPGAVMVFKIELLGVLPRGGANG